MLINEEEIISEDLKSFFAISSDAAVFINQAAEISYTNKKGNEMLENHFMKSLQGGKNLNFIELIKKSSLLQADKIIKTVNNILQAKKEKCELECSFEQEKSIYYKIIISTFKKGALILFKDISAAKRTEEQLFQEKRWADALFENSDSAIALLDEEHCVLDINRKFEETFSYKLENIIGRDLDQILFSGKKNSINRDLTAKVLNGKSVEAEGIRYDKYGKAINFKIKGVPIIVKEKLKGVYAVYEDISERKVAESKIKALEERYRTIFENAPMGILLLDYKGTVLQANETLLDYSGYKRSELVGKSIFETVVLAGNEDQARKSISKILAGEDQEFVGESVKKSGEVYPLLFKETRIKIPGRGHCVLSMQLDYSDYKKQQEKIKYIGYHDQLTGCYNRNYIENVLDEYAQQKFLPLGIMMIDINGLTLINESYGYKKGDQLLIRVAEKLNDFLAEDQLLGRWTGDEFIILLPKISEQKFKELRAKINEFCDSTEEEQVPITLGVGRAVYQQANDSIYQLINEADRRMNQDKLTKDRSSKNKFVKNLLNTLGAKSNETKEHALRMTSLAFNLGERLNLSHEKLNELNLLATLHDIGKVTISEKILSKKSALNDEEWKIIKTHPVKGAAIADSTEEFAPIAKYIRHHHERWDGGGYPDGLKREEIPLLSRIITLVDSYDVMTNDRPYKKAMSKVQAIKEIKDCAGSQFDPELAAEFIWLLEEGENNG